MNPGDAAIPTGRPAAVGPARESRPFTLVDLNLPQGRIGGMRQLPRITLGALRMVWKACPWNLVATLLLQVGAGASVGIQLLVARTILKDMVAVTHGASPNALYPDFGLLVGVMAALAAISALVQHQQGLLVELVGQHAFARIVGVAADVELESFEDPEFYDQLQRARTSGSFRTIDLVNGISSLTTATITSLGIAAVLLFLQPLLLVFVAVAAVPVLIATLYNSRQAYTFEYAMTPESRERMYVMELLTERDSAKEVRVFDTGPFLEARYRALTTERLRHLRAFLRRRLGVALLGGAAGAIGIGIALGALVFLLAHHRLGVASALTAAVAMQQLSARVTTMATSLGKLIESGMFLDDYQRFLGLASDRVARPAETPRTSMPLARVDALRVEGLSFTYPGTERLVLDRISLAVNAGEVVALVGENGSGKTTLVKLICQLYRPDAGCILWNEHDATTLEPVQIRDGITVLFQDFIQYHLTALENIRLGRVERECSLDDVVAAAVRAGADDFVSSLPRGYETRLGRKFYGGHELSIGQWQRLALARAFFRDGQFLILDEPTASLDPRAEHDLFTQMRSLSAGRSVLLVSHRFSSVRSADRIYVLQHGRVTESGTHDELMARGGHYAELFDLQAAAYLSGR